MNSKDEARQFHIDTFTDLIGRADHFKSEIWMTNCQFGDDSFTVDQAAVFVIGSVPLNVGRWTSVDERMPRDDVCGAEYLVYDVEQDVIQIAAWAGCSFVHPYNGLDSITHWMPMPGRPPINPVQEDG